jgi:hypothetical protein
MALACARWPAASLIESMTRCPGEGFLHMRGRTFKRVMPKGIILGFEMEVQ